MKPVAHARERAATRRGFCAPARLRHCAAVLLVACSSGPQPEVAPQPASPAAATVAAPAPTAMLTPHAASGSYRLTASIQSSGRRTPRGGQNGAIQLSAEPAAVPMMGAPSGAQFNAAVALGGYTRAPRGRTGQAAAWWPIGGDSVVVQFASTNAAQIQLRGAVRGGTIRGEIWFLSMATGATFQMGTFVATRGGR